MASLPRQEVGSFFPRRVGCMLNRFFTPPETIAFIFILAGCEFPRGCKKALHPSHRGQKFVPGVKRFWGEPFSPAIFFRLPSPSWARCTPPLESVRASKSLVRSPCRTEVVGDNSWGMGVEAAGIVRIRDLGAFKLPNFRTPCPVLTEATRPLTFKV